MHKLPLADAKKRFNIFDLWRHFGFEGEPRTSCRSPFRDDRNPSFSVSTDGCLWHDFATGEAGDAVDFLQRASGLSKRESCRKFIELAGGSLVSVPQAAYRPRTELARVRPTFPEFNDGKPADLAHLSALRNVSPDAVALAQERGLLRFAQLHGLASWVITDYQRVNAQARRLDGSPWEHLDGSPKAWTLSGSWGAWPIGIKEAQEYPAIALVEGGPDLLAALHFIACEGKQTRCSPVAMLGASHRIHADALTLIAGKIVRIFGHADPEGQLAVRRWAAELTRAGAIIDAFNFSGLRKVDGSDVNDLNDLTSICADDFEAHRELWSLIP
jgi:hypothetical protein